MTYGTAIFIDAIDSGATKVRKCSTRFATVPQGLGYCSKTYSGAIDSGAIDSTLKVSHFFRFLMQVCAGHPAAHLRFLLPTHLRFGSATPYGASGTPPRARVARALLPPLNPSRLCVPGAAGACSISARSAACAVLHGTSAPQTRDRSLALAACSV